LSNTKRILLIVLSFWLLFVSAFVFNYTAPADSLIYKSSNGRIYLNEDSRGDFNLIESKVITHDYLTSRKIDVQLVILPVWTKAVINLFNFESAFYIRTYITKISNEIVFRDFLRIFPFHFFF
jgi:hypothetical protein